MRIRELLLAACLLGVGWGASPAHAASALDATIQVNGSSLPGPQVALDPARGVRLDLSLTNRGTAPVTVASVHLTGDAMGILMFGAGTPVALEVGPGERVDQRITMDVSHLRHGAVGAVSFAIELRDPAGRPLVTRSGTVDVAGSPLRSLWGMYCLAALVLAALNVGQLVIAVRRRRLPARRSARIATLALCGFGVGLAVIAGLSLSGLMAPVWWLALPLVTALAVAAGVVGHFAPTRLAQVSHT